MMMMTMTMMMTLLMVGHNDKHHHASYDFINYKDLLIIIIKYTSDKSNGHGGANYEDDFDDNESPGDYIDDYSSVMY